MKLSLRLALLCINAHVGKEPNIHASVELSAERGSVPLGIAAHDAYRVQPFLYYSMIMADS